MRLAYGNENFYTSDTYPRSLDDEFMYPVRDLRILALHGYHGSAAVLRQQMSSLTASLCGVEFVHVDAPSLAEGDFGWWHSPAEGPAVQPGAPMYDIAAAFSVRVAFIGGGIPVTNFDGVVIGAIGVGGGSPDQDHEVAAAALAAI